LTERDIHLIDDDNGKDHCSRPGMEQSFPFAAEGLLGSILKLMGADPDSCVQEEDEQQSIAGMDQSGSASA
jgi:hypothetical protein